MMYSGFMAYIDSLRVKNFQSIEEVEVGFAPGLTTIVGQSSTGKSAILRAFRTLAHNTNKPQVRAGKTTLEVLANLTDGHKVSVVRGKSKSTYQVDDEQYTKAGVSVPEPVAQVLNLSRNEPDVHFSFQFDKPYLLAESGSVVSAVLAKLTQANVLREAVREGSRLSQQNASLAKTRRQDATNIMEKLKADFSDVPQKQEALKRATERTDEAEKIFSSVQPIESCLATLGDLKPKIDVLESVQPIDRDQEIQNAQTALSEAQAIKSICNSLEALSSAVEDAVKDLGVKQESQAAIAKRYDELLHSLGVCPTCGQTV